MKSDGTVHEQLTFDETNDWFLHLSPDGKWIVYLSFPPTIDPDSHPHYKRVELKLMPVAGGAPRVLPERLRICLAAKAASMYHRGRRIVSGWRL